MPTSSPKGRELLLDAAERLMAERGVRGVSLRDITAAAEQRNASGIQYHFGNRAGLVAAVIGRHMERIDARRNALLDQLERRRTTSVRDVVAALVEPLAEALATPGGRRYLRIIDELLEDPEVVAPDADLTGLNRSLERAGKLLAPALRELPPTRRAARRELCTTFLLRALAMRARAVEQDDRPAMSDADFTANLVDMLAGGMLASPSSPATAPRTPRAGRPAARDRAVGRGAPLLISPQTVDKGGEGVE